MKDSGRHIGSSDDSPFDVTPAGGYWGNMSAFLWQEAVLRAGFSLGTPDLAVHTLVAGLGWRRDKRTGLPDGPEALQASERCLVQKICLKHLSSLAKEHVAEIHEEKGMTSNERLYASVLGTSSSPPPAPPPLPGSRFKYLDGNARLQFSHLIRR